MQLNRTNISAINRLVYNIFNNDKTPPARVIQFGSGVLLRGLPAFCIDAANRKETFKGGIIIVKSTQSGSIAPFKEQDCLYTLRTAGLQNNQVVETEQIISSIIDIIDANTSWSQVLSQAEDPKINILISNTTERGIVYAEDDICDSPPSTFPGKVASYLYHRFKSLGNEDSSRIIVLPTELIDDNAQQLKKIVQKLASKQELPLSFLHWLETHVYFCNTLVDRIVPGAYKRAHTSYVDHLAITAEPYFLWAIESTASYVRQELTFMGQSIHTPILPLITDIKEIKIRILNGTHTLLAAIALLSGHQFVKDSLHIHTYESFINNLVQKEIIPCLEAQGIAKNQIFLFSDTLIDRLKNPYIEHQWLSIAQNYHAKIKSRILPLLASWYRIQADAPTHISFGFAAYLFLMKQRASMVDAELLQSFQSMDLDHIATSLSDLTLWGIDLTAYKGLAPTIQHYLTLLKNSTIEHLITDL